MIIKNIKRILSLFLLFIFSSAHIVSYAYDSFFVSFDTNTAINTSIIFLPKTQITPLKVLSNKYDFFDGSHTIIHIKGLNTTAGKLNFLTNYKGIFIKSEDIGSIETFLKQNKKSTKPEQKYIFTSYFWIKNDKKEKDIIKNIQLLWWEEIVSFKNSFLSQFVLSQIDIPYYGRGPPYIISLIKI